MFFFFFFFFTPPFSPFFCQVDFKTKCLSSLIMQKDMVHDKLNSKPAYSLQHLNAHSVSCPQEIRMFPASNQRVQTIMFPMNAPRQSHLSPIGQNAATCSTVTPQVIGGLPITSPITAPPAKSSVIGSTDSR